MTYDSDLRYEEIIQDELDKLDYLPSAKANRDATIRALALAEVDGRSRRSVLVKPSAERPPNVVGARTYYGKDKPYHHDKHFNEVLERVAEIYRRRENAIKEAADADERRKRHEHTSALIQQGKILLAEAFAEWQRALAAARKAREEAIAAGDAQGALISVLDMKPTEIALFMQRVFGEERLVFDEEPAQKIDAAVSWTEGMPDGVSEQYADRQLDALAAALVRQQLKDAEQSGFDLDELI